VRAGDLGIGEVSETRFLKRLPSPRAWTDHLGRRLFFALLTIRGLGAFTLITLVVMVTKFRTAAQVMRPLVRREIYRSGVRMLPMFAGLSGVLGFVIIGQAVSAAYRVGVVDIIGNVMVIAVVRELGPLLTAMLVLARVGTANVVELGTARAQGEVEALEALGIDPVHYMVAPRVAGMALGVFALTVFVVLGTVFSGYLWIFVQDVPLLPGDYFRQLAGALRALDFVALALKTCGFGLIISVVTCYHGLAQPLHLGEVSRATVRAVGQSVIACMLLDALFIILYLLAS
jgi:phospholipid/cholesterol/gamma-HCH transport system permease protein